MSYVATIRPPVTLTESEQARLLKITGEHVDGFRDHIIFAIALGTGMRSFEILALNVGDVYVARNGKGLVKRRVTLRVFKNRKGSQPAPQDVFIPDALVHKLRKFAKWKCDRGQSLAVDAPLFMSRKNNRLGLRGLGYRLKLWQEVGNFDRIFTFHHLRHSALSNVYRKTRDLRLAQRVGRHKHIQTTTIYATPTDEDILRAVRLLPC